MKRYKLVTIQDFYRPRILATDPADIDWLLGELKEYLPSYKTYYGDFKMLHTGESYYIGLEKLSDRDYDVAWWLIARLCEAGWEPFAVSTKLSGGGTSSISTTAIYHFRKEVKGAQQ